MAAYHSFATTGQQQSSQAQLATSPAFRVARPQHNVWLSASEYQFRHPNDGRKWRPRCWLKRQIMRAFVTNQNGVRATAKQLAAYLHIPKRTVEWGIAVLIRQGFVSNVRVIYRPYHGVLHKEYVERRLHPMFLLAPGGQAQTGNHESCVYGPESCGIEPSPEGKSPPKGIRVSGFCVHEKQKAKLQNQEENQEKATPRKRNGHLEAARHAYRIFTKSVPRDFASLCDVSPALSQRYPRLREVSIITYAEALLTWFIYRAAHPQKGEPQIARDVKYYVKAYDNFAAGAGSAEKLENLIAEYAEDRYRRFAEEFVRQVNPELADWIEAPCKSV